MRNEKNGTQIKPGRCGACARWVPPVDVLWRFRRNKQTTGECERHAESRFRDDGCTDYNPCPAPGGRSPMPESKKPGTRPGF